MTDLIEKLSIKNVVDLVLVSMRLLPDEIPESFHSIYTPIVDAGSPAQIEQLARLLNAQLTAVGYELTKSQQVITAQIKAVMLRFYFSLVNQTSVMLLKKENLYQVKYMLNMTIYYHQQQQMLIVKYL